MKPASKTSGHPAAGRVTENQQSHSDVKQGHVVKTWAVSAESQRCHQHVMTTNRPLRHLQEPSVDAYHAE